MSRIEMLKVKFPSDYSDEDIERVMKSMESNLKESFSTIREEKRIVSRKYRNIVEATNVSDLFEE